VILNRLLDCLYLGARRSGAISETRSASPDRTCSERVAGKSTSTHEEWRYAFQPGTEVDVSQQYQPRSNSSRRLSSERGHCWTDSLGTSHGPPVGVSFLTLSAGDCRLVNCHSHPLIGPLKQVLKLGRNLRKGRTADAHEGQDEPAPIHSLSVRA
jgi:hypothetical protein